MLEVSRRQFLKRTATSAAAAGCFSAVARELRADPLGMPIGCQTYPVRAQIAQDFAGAMKELAGIGYRTIELCSPLGRFGEAGFNAIAKYKGAEIRKILDDAGLRCQSSHFYFDEMRANLDQGIGWATDLGLTQIMAAGLQGPATPTMDDVKRAADECNKIGERVQKAGMVLGLHNGAFEAAQIDGKRVYDELLRLLDPNLVKFQLHTRNGFDAAQYFTSNPGRYISLHLQDWDAEIKTAKPVGQGTLDWKKIFAAAKTCGVKNYFVDMGPMDVLRTSYAYVHALQV